VVGSDSRAIAATCQVVPRAISLMEQPPPPPPPPKDRHAQAVAYGTSAAARIADVMEPKHHYHHYGGLLAQADSGGGGDDGTASSVSSAGTGSIAYYKEAETRRALAESEIRWGCVKMPRSWYQMYEVYAAKVQHLSFGAREDGVEAPFEGCWHA
jgi:hypothetical protein